MNDLLAAAAQHNTSAAGVGEHSPGTAWSTAAPRAKLLAICVATSVEALPVECTAVAVVRSGRVEIAAGQATAVAEAVGVSGPYLEQVVHALAPLIDPDGAGAGLPRDVLLSGLFGAGGIAERLAGGWREPSLTAVLGVGAVGPLTVDLERDGPHVLIAGTTGSGKSELLQTLVAGLACSAPPDRTSFLLVDYKGGAAFDRLALLPHTTGVVTDLDKTTATRALASLRAEVRRREHILADAGAADMAALRGQPGGAAPPSLVIVVDEFAALGADLPDFLNGLLDVAQRGRSLGLHLVLATQRPAGVLSPAIKANIGLRICLRVTDDADSVDVIDTAEAARLSADLVGRALLRRERSRTTMFQVARVTGTRAIGHLVRLRDDDVHPQVLDAGNGGRSSDLDEVIQAALTAAAGIEKPGAALAATVADDLRARRSGPDRPARQTCRAASGRPVGAAGFRAGARRTWLRPNGDPAQIRLVRGGGRRRAGTGRSWRRPRRRGRLAGHPLGSGWPGSFADPTARPAIARRAAGKRSDTGAADPASGGRLGGDQRPAGRTRLRHHPGCHHRPRRARSCCRHTGGDQRRSAPAAPQGGRLADHRPSAGR